MATQTDPLRNTLDHLALDPNAASDRPYLISVLRRLGYTDMEIKQYLGEPLDEPLRESGPAPTPEPVERAEVEIESDEPRIIEVEYTGPDLEEQQFELIQPRDGTTGFTIGEGDDLASELGAGLEAGEEEFFDDFDVDSISDEEAAWDDDWGEGGNYNLREREEAEKAEQRLKEIAEEHGLDLEDEDSITFFQEREPTIEEQQEMKINSMGGVQDADALVTFNEFYPREVMGQLVPAEADPDPWATDVSTEEAERHQGVDGHDAWPALDEDAGADWPEETSWPEPDEENPWPEPTADDQETPGWGATDTEPTWEPAEEAWNPVDDTVTADIAPESEAAFQEQAGAETTGDAPFTYGDYTLYARDVELSTGRTQRIYFFAKSTPKSGNPSPLPEGYEVHENDRTGLPFLRKVHAMASDDAPVKEDPSSSPPRRRIRVRRVRAESREEAERLVREQGGDVRAAVPIDLEEHDVEDDQA